MICVIE
ncbi:hypothetical protein ID866_8106 [Astraeus odoratus]|nr:hypothetical protein ID866_8106 [Astraeus odoratus]